MPVTPSQHAGSRLCRIRVQELLSKCEEFHRDCREAECTNHKRQRCTGAERRSCLAEDASSMSKSKAKNPCVFFCLGCGGRPLCQNCSQAAHQHHDTVQVLYTTHKKAVQAAGVIEKYVDTRRIQKLKNNGKYVVLLRSRQARNSNDIMISRGSISNGKQCRSCMFKFAVPSSADDAAEFDFCSIECCMLMERLESSGGDVNAPEIADEIKAPVRRSASRRKSSTPRRAPFQ